VEVWFSILSAKALAGASFTSPRQVRDQIDGKRSAGPTLRRLTASG
jgi:hypothetical protein